MLRGRVAAALVGFSAIVGSFIPLASFFFLPVKDAMIASVIIACAVLFFIGAYTRAATTGRWLRGGIELMVIGGTAAIAGFLVGALFKVPVQP